MSEDRKMELFNNEKMVVTHPIMLQFGYLKNLIDWASEDLYRWADKTREMKGDSCSILEYLQCVGERLEQYFNTSLVLSIYAILEDGLKRISEFYEFNIEANVKISDFEFYNCTTNEYCNLEKKISHKKEYNFRKTSSLEQYATFLEKIGIYCKADDKYKRLAYWRLVRNSIIHAGSEIKSKKDVEKIKKIVKIDDILEEISSYSFIIDDKTLKEFIDLVEQYLSSIFNYKIANIRLQEQESL